MIEMITNKTTVNKNDKQGEELIGNSSGSDERDHTNSSNEN
jgi:hypothetical protein